MMECPKCRIRLTGALDQCPLCGSPLEGTPVPSPYPCLPVQRASKRSQLILAAATVAALVAWIVICFVLSVSVPIGLAVVAALALNYIFARNLMVHSPNALRAIKRYFLVLMMMALLWFAATGSTIACTFVIPAISITAILFDVVLLILLGNRMVEEYAKYLLHDIVFGAVPPLLILTGCVSWPPLTWACPVLAALMVAGLAISSRKTVANEARKLFNA
ncbi:MAG: hypothetical protein HFJ65_06750 [Eggerthellaceae bacterium]|nr:hypothetical protein [Eggerthellaceae bacterium]